MSWLKSYKSNPLPESLFAYKNGFQDYKPNPDITKNRYIVFDTETTGLNPKRDLLLSIGAVTLVDLKIQVAQTFERFIQHSTFTGGDHIQIHGILPGVGLASLQESIPDFLNFIGTSILIGHHVAFDIAMINNSLKKCGWSLRLKNRYIDTFHLAVRLEQGRSGRPVTPGKYTLDAVAQSYAIRLHDRHTATGDAYLTALVFLHQLAALQKRGVKKTKELL